jgi:putative transcriptional regulator
MKGKSLKEAIHETAQGFYEVGVMNEQTMREFDTSCLPPVKNYSPNQIKRIRQRNKASQAVFAAYLNTSSSTVQKWEQGQKHPSGIALKLLNLVDKHGLAFIAA